MCRVRAGVRIRRLRVCFTPFAMTEKDDVPVSHPDVIMPAVKKPAGVKK
jgi:hypothetical protein